jgi:hypothetical protein
MELLYAFTGYTPSLHSGVYVSGHFNNLAAAAFLPPPRSPAKSMGEPRSSPLLSLGDIMPGPKPDIEGRKQL